MNESKDYTSKICDLVPLNGDWPMYSFSSPSYSFWNGFANGLHDRGFTEKEIEEWLRSKLARWLMDSKSHEISDLGYEMSKTAKKPDWV